MLIKVEIPFYTADILGTTFEVPNTELSFKKTPILRMKYNVSKKQYLELYRF